MIEYSVPFKIRAERGYIYFFFSLPNLVMLHTETLARRLDSSSCWAGKTATQIALQPGECGLVIQFTVSVRKCRAFLPSVLVDDSG